MIVWDDQKTDGYAFQSDFSYRMNQLSRRQWITYNVIGGAVLGAIMALIVYAVSDRVFSDPARVMIAILVGVWPTKFTEIRAERTTKAAQISMAVVFAIGIVIYAVCLAGK